MVEDFFFIIVIIDPNTLIMELKGFWSIYMTNSLAYFYTSSELDNNFSNNLLPSYYISILDNSCLSLFLTF